MIDAKAADMRDAWDAHGRTFALHETSLYVVEDRREAGIQTRVMRATCYALPVARLVELMQQAGFADVRRLDGAFYQPLVIGRRPGVDSA